MPTYVLDISAFEIVHILQAEIESGHGEPELNVSCEREYELDEDRGRTPSDTAGPGRCDLVTSTATLNIEPRVEQNYWVLEAAVTRVRGLRPEEDEWAFAREELTADDFEAELRSVGYKQVTVRLHAENPLSRQHFDDWLSEMRRIHPYGGQSFPEDGTGEDAPMVSAQSWVYGTREAVAAFVDADSFEAAVDELEISGFDRAAISVLATGADAKRRIEGFHGSIEEIEDSGELPRAAFVSRDSRTEGEAAAVAVPSYIAGLTGAWAVMAAGGALGAAFAAMVAAGIAAAGLGGLLSHAIARNHLDSLKEQIAHGGMVLWVSVSDPKSEERALGILERMGGMHVHAHEIQRRWSITEIPYALSQPDPLLERG